MVERLAFNQSVAGSSPAILILNLLFLKKKSQYLMYRYWFNFIQKLTFKVFSSITTLDNIYVVSRYRYLLLPYSTLRKGVMSTRSLPWDSTKIVTRFKSPVSTTIHRVNIYKYTSAYMTLANTLSESLFRVHAYHKNFFTAEVGKHFPPYINIARYLTHWRSTHLFLYNMFFYQARFLTFASMVFNTEVNSMNWSFFNNNYTFFKYSVPFLTVKNMPYGEELLMLKNELWGAGFLNAIVVDLSYHYQTISFIDKLNLFSIGLVPHTSDPWVVNYPIPCGINSLLTQFFFINFILLVRQHALKGYYGAYFTQFKTYTSLKG
jgi:hypothetical protein